MSLKEWYRKLKSEQTKYTERRTVNCILQKQERITMSATGHAPRIGNEFVK